ncbi:MAG: helix-turn-helix domain-containing protein [Actinomycetia bacterium]|nr:helix-turn-helix domain-containing protein [Actinomycetes bacterium]
MQSPAPEPPADFWEHPLVSDALTARDMGAVIRAYRQHPWHGRRGLSQSNLAEWGGVTQGQLSRIENGRSRVRDIDRLIAWARVLRIPEQILWFTIPHDPPTEPGPSRSMRAVSPRLLSTSADHDIAAQTLDLIRRYAVIDNLTGPRQVLRPVSSHLRHVVQLLSNADGSARGDLLLAATRTAELLGWLYQDAGDLQSAMRLTDRALRYSHELGDRHHQAYVLMRQSTMATDAGDPQRALALCAAALRDRAQLTPQMIAVVLRQQAAAQALRNNAAQVMANIDQARTVLAGAPNDPEHPSADLTAYVTPGYLDMEAAACLVQLGRGDRAVDTIERALSTWQPGFRRELGLCLARASVAYTAVEDIDQAQAAAQNALRIGAESHSARTLRELQHARTVMINRGLTEPAADLHNGLRALVRDDNAREGRRGAIS